MDLYTASALGLENVISKNILKNPATILFPNQKSWTPLMYACMYCQEHLVSLFLNSVPSCIYSINEKMQTPLMLATKSGNLNIVKLLTTKEMLESKDINGWTALYYAVIYEHVEIIGYLIRNGANVNARDYNSWTILMAAVKQGKENIVELLIGYEADYEMKTNTGLKAIDLAFQLKNFKLVNLLSIPAVTDLESLMSSLCLDKYSLFFKEKGVDLGQFLKFNEEDLRHIGIRLLGPRRKMSLAIGKLNHLNNLKLYLQTDFSRF